MIRIDDFVMAKRSHAPGTQHLAYVPNVVGGSYVIYGDLSWASRCEWLIPGTEVE
jgi:hypothetical protein